MKMTVDVAKAPFMDRRHLCPAFVSSRINCNKAPTTKGVSSCQQSTHMCQHSQTGMFRAHTHACASLLGCCLQAVSPWSRHHDDRGLPHLGLGRADLHMQRSSPVPGERAIACFSPVPPPFRPSLPPPYPYEPHSRCRKRRPDRLVHSPRPTPRWTPGQRATQCCRHAAPGCAGTPSP